MTRPQSSAQMKLHPAMLPIDDLLADCKIDSGRAGGPGGQHRNKVDTAIDVTHIPTGISASGSERRSQSMNRNAAIFRLRLKLAVQVRRTVSPSKYQPSELWKQRRQGEKMPVNPKHKDYPHLLAEALDVVYARKFDVAGAAGVLGITMSQLARLIRHHGKAFSDVNKGRKERDLHPLK